MGKKKGDSFVTQPPFEILLALVFTFLVIGFIIAQSGGMNSILKSICDKIPVLCQGSVSTQEYEIAKQSKSIVKCGIDTVLSGTDQCAGILTKTSAGTSVTGKAAADTTVQQASQVQSNTVDASLYCDFKQGYLELEFDACGALNPFCHHEDIWFVFESGEWKWKCPDLGKNYYDYKSLSEMTAIFDKVDDIYQEIQSNMLKITSKNQNEKFKNGLEVLKNAVIADNDKIIVHHKSGASETFKTSDINQFLLLSAEKEATCEVRNFNLPENFAGITGDAKEYINGMGDPSFLLYYQIFPMGEDTDWAGESEWQAGVAKVMFITMCVMDVARPLFKAKQIATNALKKGSEKLISRFGKSVTDDAIVNAQRLAPELADKVEGKAILKVMQTDTINNGIVTYFKNKYPGRDPAQLFREIAPPEKIGGQIAEKYSYKELQTGFIDVAEGKFSSVDLTAMLLDKAEPSLLQNFMAKTIARAKNPAVLANFAKYAGIDYGLAYYAARFDSELGKFIVVHPNSLVLGMPLVREEEDKLVSKIVIPKPDKIYSPNKQNLIELGKPVILVKKKGNTPVPFYLASPCMADLTIKSEPMSCGIYSHETISGLTTCDSPDDSIYGSWWDRLQNEKLPQCGSLLTGYDKMYEHTKDVSQNIVEKISNVELTKETSFTGKDGSGNDVTENRLMIKDPISGIAFYYDKSNKIIDKIGGNFNFIVSGKYDYGVYNVKDLLQWVYDTKKAGVVCAGVTDKNNLMCFDSKWEEFKDNTSNLFDVQMIQHQVIKTTNSGEKGFVCRERVLGNDITAIGVDNKQYKAEGNVEKFMIGVAEIPNDTVFLVCDVLPYLQYQPGGAVVYDNRWSLYFEKNTGKFYGIHDKVKESITPYGRFDVVIKDINMDGTADQFSQYFLDIGWISVQDEYTLEQSSERPEEYYQYRVFTDKDYSGTIDSVMSTNCRVPSAITITLDKKDRKDSNGNNYCYKSKSQFWNIVSTIGSFGADAFAKTGSGMFVSAVVDCGIAFLQWKDPLKIMRSNWPGSGA
jgi:hypothetical protein